MVECSFTSQVVVGSIPVTVTKWCLKQIMFYKLCFKIFEFSFLCFSLWQLGCAYQKNVMRKTLMQYSLYYLRVSTFYDNCIFLNTDLKESLQI